MKRGVSAAMLAVMSPVSLVQGAVQIHSLLVSGFQAPGAPSGTTLTSFGSVNISSHGEMSIRGSMNNNSSLQGLWSTQGGGMTLLARSNAPAPVTPAANYGSLLQGGIADNGKAGFTGTLTNFGPAIFTGDTRGTQLVAWPRTPPPGLSPGSYFTNPFSGPSGGGIISGPSFNAVGQAAFYATALDFLGPLGETFGIWAGGATPLAPIALTWTQAPGFPQDCSFEFIGGSQSPAAPKINDSGTTAFTATVRCFSSGQEYGAIYSGSLGGLSLVAKQSDSAPGGGTGAVLSVLGNPGINNAEHVSFYARLSGPTINGSNYEGIWSTSGGTLHKVAQTGDYAPGTSPGVVFGTITDRLVLNGADQTTVLARLSGVGIDATRDSGLWMERNGLLQLVYHEGMQVPGATPGVVFTESSTSGFGLTSNAAGQVVFRQTFTGGEGIFAADSLGNLEMVLRSGQIIEVLPGTFKTIWYFTWSEYTGGDDGGSSLNDMGQFAINVNYTDGTQGILVATIPEPASIALLAAALLPAFRLPRRRCRARS